MGKIDPNNQDYRRIGRITLGYLPIFIHDKNKFIELYVKVLLGMKLITKNTYTKNLSKCNYSQVYHYIDGKKLMNLYDNLPEPLRLKFMNWLEKKEYIVETSDKDTRQTIAKLPEFKSIVTTASINKPQAFDHFMESYCHRYP